MKENSKKVLLEHGWEQVPNRKCLFVHRENGLFLSVYVDEVKLVGKKQNIDPMWNVLVKEVDLGEPTSFFDHVFFLVALNENVKQAKILWTIIEICLNPKSVLELRKSYLSLRNLEQTFLHGSMIGSCQ